MGLVSNGDISAPGLPIRVDDLKAEKDAGLGISGAAQRYSSLETNETCIGEDVGPEEEWDFAEVGNPEGGMRVYREEAWGVRGHWSQAVDMS